jgi:hypothetical protein
MKRLERQILWTILIVTYIGAVLTAFVCTRRIYALDRRLQSVQAQVDSIKTRQDSIPGLMVYFTMEQVKAMNPSMKIDSIRLNWHVDNAADTTGGKP